MAYGNMQQDLEEARKRKAVERASTQAPRSIVVPSTGNTGTGGSMSAGPRITPANPGPGWQQQSTNQAVARLQPQQPQIINHQTGALANQGRAAAIPTGRRAAYAAHSGQGGATPANGARGDFSDASTTNPDGTTTWGDIGNPNPYLRGDGRSEADKAYDEILSELSQGFDAQQFSDAIRADAMREAEGQLSDQRARMGRVYGGAGGMLMANELAQDIGSRAAAEGAQARLAGEGLNLRALDMALGGINEQRRNENELTWMQEFAKAMNNPPPGSGDELPGPPPADDPGVYEGTPYISDGEQLTVEAGNGPEALEAAFGDVGYTVLQRGGKKNYATQISLGPPGTYGGLVYNYIDGKWVKSDAARFAYNATGFVGGAIGGARAAGSGQD